MNYSTELKNQILEEVKSTGNISTVAKKNKVPCSTIHTWLKNNKIQGNKTDKEHKLEVKKLKQELADKDLQLKIMKDLLKKTYQVWNVD